MTSKEINAQINRQWDNIRWTSTMINDSQEHAQIVRLEARLKDQYHLLVKLQAMKPTP